MQVVAFRDDSQKRLVLVIINNRATAINLNMDVNGLRLGGNLTGERSTVAAAWQPLTPFVTDTSTSLLLTVSAQSVTTITGQVAAFADK